MKISAYSIIVLGLVIGIVVLSYGFFQKWQPNMTATQYQRDYATQLTDEIKKTKKAEDRFKLAQKMRDEKAAAWQVFVAQNTPPAGLAQGGINLDVDPWQLAIDTPKFRDMAQRQINAQLVKGGVKVLAGPEVPTPEPPNSTGYLASYFNLTQFDYPIVIWELGTVRVRGTYRQITDNVRAWSHMKGFLAEVDGLAVTGTGTPLEATYNLVVVGYLKGKNFFGGVNEGTAVASTAGAGGGAPAGGMGGVRTGPGAGAGGPAGMPPGKRGGMMSTAGAAPGTGGAAAN